MLWKTQVVLTCRYSPGLSDKNQQHSTMINNDEPWTITVMNQGQSWVMTHHNHPRSSRFSQYWYGSFSFRMVFFCLKCQALRSCGARSDSHNSILNHNLINSTLWLFNIAMENGPFIAGLPVYLLKIVIFHGYVSHNQRVVPNEPGSIINHVYTPKAWVSIVSPACGLQSFSNGQGSHGSNSSSAPSSPQ